MRVGVGLGMRVVMSNSLLFLHVPLRHFAGNLLIPSLSTLSAPTPNIILSLLLSLYYLFRLLCLSFVLYIALRRFSLQQAYHLPFSRMEESINSSMNGASCAKDGSASSEESGWTMYFEEFMASEERKAAGGFSSGVVGGFSIVSDAASCVAFDPSSPGLEVSEEKYRKMSLKKKKKKKKKKKRGKGLLDDDSLEDTASSPVNSPKGLTSGGCCRVSE
ncbi:uncharacterized protein LOC135677777 isoform X2 [Musa acuminata AAA Group]|uniref:uncharacterized protein LOC135677777 isoform X2 n=1 Tax=Musa acuminata AAA Group TaxID=214697 RepID=UPI0031E2874E